MPLISAASGLLPILASIPPPLSLSPLSVWLESYTIVVIPYCLTSIFPYSSTSVHVGSHLAVLYLFFFDNSFLYIYIFCFLFWSRPGWVERRHGKIIGHFKGKEKRLDEFKCEWRFRNLFNRGNHEAWSLTKLLRSGLNGPACNLSQLSLPRHPRTSLFSLHSISSQVIESLVVRVSMAP